jgi:predicted N-acetyltransferase YhbS
MSGMNLEAPPIGYQIEPHLSADEFIDVLVRSTLAERRPVHDREVIAGMLRHADLIVTARAGAVLVGVSRAITDYSYCTYLSDLAVDRAFQGHGIGRELVRRTHEAAGLHTSLILLAAPGAASYYPHIGLTRHDSCWIIPRTARAATPRPTQAAPVEGEPPCAGPANETAQDPA